MKGISWGKAIFSGIKCDIAFKTFQHNRIDSFIPVGCKPDEAVTGARAQVVFLIHFGIQKINQLNFARNLGTFSVAGVFHDFITAFSPRPVLEFFEHDRPCGSSLQRFHPEENVRCGKTVKVGDHRYAAPALRNAEEPCVREPPCDRPVSAEQRARLLPAVLRNVLQVERLPRLFVGD